MSNVDLFTCKSPFLDNDKIYPPLAGLYLKSYVETHLPNTTVRLHDNEYDLNNSDSFDHSDLIGISIMTPQREEASRMLKVIKDNFPEKKVFAGGPHVQNYWRDMLKEGWDHLVVGDGEKALVKIIQGNAGIIINDQLSRSSICNAPRPARLSDDGRRILGNYSYKLNDRNATTLITGRGCPMSCTFCEDAQTQVRWTGTSGIKRELDDIVSLGYGGVYIFDDLFAISLNTVRPICDMLKEHDLVYRCNGQVKYFTRNGEDFAKMLADTGCVEIAFGFESGSQKILDTVRKGTTVEQNYKAIEFAKKHGLKVKGFLMIGLPGESYSTIDDTEEFISSSGMDDFQLAVYMPFKGTEIRRRIDAGDSIDLQMVVKQESGAYGIKGGETAYEVRTKALSAFDLERIRNDLVMKYRPNSHRVMWGVE